MQLQPSTMYGQYQLAHVQQNFVRTWKRQVLQYKIRYTFSQKYLVGNYSISFPTFVIKYHSPFNAITKVCEVIDLLSIVASGEITSVLK